jgi:hypothetical protein
MIPKFYSGQPVRASDLNALAEEIRKNEITKFNGGTFQRNTGGTSLTVNAGGGEGGGGGGTDASYRPFQIIDGYPVEQGGVVIRVSGNSWLTNIETGEKITITGLGAAPGSPQDNANDQGQFPLPAIGEYIWLTVECQGLDIIGATIEYGAVGAAPNWADFPKPVEFGEGSTIKYAGKTRVAIAQVHAENSDYVTGTSYTTETGEVRVVRQLVTTHLGIQWGIVESTVAPLLVPYHASPQIAAPPPPEP